MPKLVTTDQPFGRVNHTTSARPVSTQVSHGGVAEVVAFDHVIGVEDAGGLVVRIGQWAREEAQAADSPSADAPIAEIPTVDDGRTVLADARRGDPEAQRLVARAGRVLGIITGVFGSLFDPRRVVLSGLAAEDADDLVEAARASLPLELDLPAPELVPSTLGFDVVCIGAVSAALEAAYGRARPRLGMGCRTPDTRPRGGGDPGGRDAGMRDAAPDVSSWRGIRSASRRGRP